jgi:Tfp pilus assembly protein PilN
LGEALRALAHAAGDNAGVLGIALLGPLTEVRTLDLPPLRDDERLRLLARNAARYFINVREPQIVGVAPMSRLKSNAVLAAATPSRLVAMIHAEAAGAELDVDTVVPAEAAWLSAAITIWPAVSRGSAAVLVPHDDRVDLLRAQDGKLLGVRRFRAGVTDAPAIAAALRESNGTATDANANPARHVVVLGPEVESRALITALSASGVSALGAPAGWREAVSSPSLAAASFVDPAERFRLRSDDAVALRNAHTRTIALQASVAAVLLLMLAAAVEWFGVKRELDVVKAERAAIAGQVRTLLDGRQTTDAMSRRFASISAAHAESPQWSAAIASLTNELDEGAYLLTMRARGDTLLLDGLARRASRAFESVERVPEFSAVRAAGEMRVERQDDGSVLERFTIQARVRRDSAGAVR